MSTDNKAFIADEEYDLDLLTDFHCGQGSRDNPPVGSTVPLSGQDGGLAEANWGSNVSPYTYHKSARVTDQTEGSGDLEEGHSSSPISLDLLSEALMTQIESEHGGSGSHDSRSMGSMSNTEKPAETDYRVWVFGNNAIKHLKGNLRTDREYQTAQQDQDHGPLIAIGAPPIGHFAQLSWPEQTTRYRRLSGGLQEEPFKLFDQATLFGQLAAVTTVEPSQRISDEYNKEAARNGAALLSSITKVPLSKFWQTFTEVCLILIFLANIGAMLYDIIVSPVYLYYKLTAFIMSVLENMIVWGMALTSKHPRFKNAPDREQKLKKQQYAENILHEVLLYPLIIISVIGFANDKMYKKPKTVYGWILIILLGIDLIDIFWTQILRVIMVYKLFRQIQKILQPGQRPTACTLIHGALLPRAYISIIGNIFAFVILMLMVGFQVNRDNYTSSDYSVSVASVLLIICLLIFPFYSLVLFVLANAYWVMEMLVCISLALGQNMDIVVDMKQNHGQIVSDALTFAVGKTEATKRRLENLRKVSRTKKFFYGLTELPIMLLLFLWGCFVAAAFFSFSGFDDVALNFAVKMSFLLVVILANVHLFVVMLASIVTVAGVTLGVLIYPITIVACFRKKFAIEDDSFVEI